MFSLFPNRPSFLYSSFLLFRFYSTALSVLGYLISLSSCLFPFSFPFLFPDWMNLCSVLFLPLCLSDNTSGQRWSILCITSATQRGTVTSTKSFTLCMVTWREWPMHACLSFIFKAWIQIFFTHTWDLAWGVFFPPLIFGPNLIYSSVVCDCCGCVRSVFAVILELQCILVCSGRLTASLSQLPETLSKPTSVCTYGPGFKHLKHTHTHTQPGN